MNSPPPPPVHACAVKEPNRCKELHFSSLWIDPQLQVSRTFASVLHLMYWQVTFADVLVTAGKWKQKTSHKEAHYER